MADIGRPTVFDAITIQKLEDAFSNDATDLQACFLANISKSSLYNYQKEHPEFLERKNALKAMTAFQAKKNIRDKIIQGDVEKSMWYVERKEKNEGFSTRTELTGGDGKDLPTPILGYVSNNNGNTEGTRASEESSEQGEENTGDTGGDISIEDNQHTPLLDQLSTER